MLTETGPRELRLLLACARVTTSPAEEAAIRDLLAGPIDWTRFVQKSLDHGVANLVGNTLGRVAPQLVQPELVPPELLEAFRSVRATIERRNQEQFDELTTLVGNLAAEGIEVIPLKGPLLSLCAYHDIGLRMFRDLDFLVRDADYGAAIAALHRLGYERPDTLTETQLDLTHRVQGQEIIFNKVNGTCTEPHTRLTSAKLGLDIDHDGLWQRATRIRVANRAFLSLSPEDEALVLAIHGGKERWWSIKWAADIAAFLTAHPELDWDTIIERARRQGCLRMMLLAASLAGGCLGAAIPATVEAAIQADPVVGRLAMSVVARWQAEQLPEQTAMLSFDLLRLHDRMSQRWRYTWRTLLLPGPSFIAAVALPRSLAFLYIPLKLGHDLIALPLYRAYCACAAQVSLVTAAHRARQRSV